MNAPEDRSKALNEHMSSGFAPRADIVAACWHVRFVPIVLQKSPSGLYEVEICNYRIGAPVLLNRCCAFQPDLESIFLAEMLKILLQHNRHKADLSKWSATCPLSGRSDHVTSISSVANVESPGGIAPPGAPRSVHEPLDSHGSRCSAASMAQLPMSE